MRNPPHPYTKALLSVVPRRDPRDRRQPQILVAIDRCSLEDPALGRPASAEAGHRAACLLLPGGA